MYEKDARRLFRLTCVSVFAVGLVFVSLVYMARVQEARSQQAFQARPAAAPAADGPELEVAAPERGERLDGDVLSPATDADDGRTWDLDYGFVPQEATGGEGVFAATHRTQNLRVEVSASGASFTPRVAAGGDWRVALRLQRYGRSGTELESIPASEPTSGGAWVELSRGVVTEWYSNNAEGLEHGVDIHSAPTDGNPAHAAVLEYAIAGDLRPRVVHDGRAVMFVGADGVRFMCWQLPEVTDSAGKELDVEFVLAASGLRLRIWDGGASYPLRVAGRLPALVWFGEARQPGARYGVSVALADVNGDGFEDRVVGADLYDTDLGGGDEGAVFVYYGSPAGFSPDADWTALGQESGGRFGVSVASAGDVNGDGHDDVLVGASGYDGSTVDAGRVFLYYGSEDGLSGGATTVESSAAEWTVTGVAAEAALGAAVAAAGDVNGDGYGDVALGAAGRVYVFHGAEAGVAGGAVSSELSGAHWSAVSIEPDAHLGDAVSSAGDVNGDGYSDLAVGAPGAGDGGGAAYVYHGSESGLSGGAREVSQRQASWSVYGEQSGGALGSSVASAGDVNGDGFDELLVGAPLHDSLLGETALEDDGAVYAFYGSVEGLSDGALTVERDVADWRVVGGASMARLGAAVAGGADRNRDGYADVLIGAPGFGALGGGGAFGFAGDASGFSGGLRQATALEAPWHVEASVTGVALGSSVTALDGAAVFLVGAPGATVVSAGDGGGAAGGDDGVALLFGGGADAPTCSADISVESGSDTVECTGLSTQFELDVSADCDITLAEWRGECSITPSGAEATVSVEGPSEGCSASCDVSVDVTCGIETTCSANVLLTVEDTTPPEILCPGDLTLEWEEGLDLSADGLGSMATATDVCDPSPSIEPPSDSTIAGSCNGAFTIERTWTATDACGNSETCVQRIELEDTTPPMFEFCPTDETISCELLTGGGGGGARVGPEFGEPMALDACDPNPQVTSEDDFVGSCGSVAGVYTRVWTATDDCGNTETCAQQITVEDMTGPVIICPADMTLEWTAALDTSPAGLGSEATATDACDFDPIVTSSDVVVPGSCDGQFTIQRTWTATDECGNDSTCLQTIHVEDTTPPDISCPPSGDVSCEFANGASIDPSEMATATDACDPSPNVTFSDSVTPGCGTTETIQRTWTATDACGNTSTCLQSIQVRDFTPPTISCAPDKTLSCIDNSGSGGGAVAFAFFDQAMASDACGTATLTSTDSFSAGCGRTGVHTRTWTATDDCGNTSTCAQNVTVMDMAPPVITCAPDKTLTCDEVIGGGATLTDELFNPATAIDDCGTPMVTFSDSFSAGCVGDVGVHTRTWTATDGCGNVSTCAQNVTVIDETPPEFDCPADVTMECSFSFTIVVGMGDFTTGGGAGVVDPGVGIDVIGGGDFGGFPGFGDYTGEVVVAPVATDDCDPEPVVTFSDVRTPGCGFTGVTMRTWKATDACGNEATCVQKITTVDTTPPTITCPADVTVDCGSDTSPVATGTAAVTDSCSLYSGVEHSDSAPQDCSGTIVRTWTATDSCGLTSTCAQSITVTPAEPPMIDCPDDLTLEANLTVSDTCGWSGELEPAIAYGCDVTVAHDAVLPLLVGQTVITWTATDKCGQTAECQQTVTVVDTTPPDAVCQDIMIFLNSNGRQFITPDRVDGGSSDDCGVTLEVEPSRFDCEDLGPNIVVLTVTDPSGNSSSCEATVTVKDSRDPTITCPPDTVRVANAGCKWIPEEGGGASRLGDPSADDNCPGVEITNNAPSMFPLGVTVVTWTATDTSGNTASCEQLVTVQDTTPPEISCPADTVREANSGCGFVPSQGGGASILGTPGATDDCTDPEDIRLWNNAPATFPLGVTIVRWTARDAAGNTATCSQTVTVVDTTPPSLVCPPDTVRSADDACLYVPPDGGGASRLGNPSVSDSCPGEVTLTNNAPATFGVGTHEVVWTATDAAGNTTTCTQLVTVVDDVPPELDCPPSISRSANLGDLYFPTQEEITATASDNCSSVNVTSDVPKGFPLGMTVVTYTAVDEQGNESTCQQTVTVSDSSAPELTCPEALTVEPNVDDCQWVGDFGMPSVMDADSEEAEIILSNDAPGAFPLGTTVVTWTATDSAGNSSTCTQEVTVEDVVAPVLTCPTGPVMAVCEDGAGTVVEFETSATDTCSEVSLVCDPPSGSVFPPGVTVVTCTATDSSGNTATCSFEVSVACGGLVLPGDCNFDNKIDLSDAVCILMILFTDAPILAPCGNGDITHPANVSLLSWNGTPTVDLASAIALLNWKFLGGPAHVLGSSCTPVEGCDDNCEL